MTAPVLFDYSGQPVRTVLVDNEPWFVAGDVAAILGYRMASDLTRRLDEEDRGTRSVRTPGGDQQMAVISEAGMFDAVLGSHVVGAREFKRWVTHEVLPSIRKTGKFGQVALPSKAELARMVIESETARELAEARVAELEPAADAWTALADAAGDYSLREAAEVLSRDGGISTGQNRLLKFLREVRWVDSKGMPYQSQIELGRLAVRTRTYDDPITGEPKLATQLRVTAKGVDAVYKLMTTPKPAPLRSVSS